MNKTNANLFYVREDGLLFVQLKKNHLHEHPDLESYFGRTAVQFPNMKIEANCVGITQTGIILDDWQIIKTVPSGLKATLVITDKLKRKETTHDS